MKINQANRNYSVLEKSIKSGSSQNLDIGVGGKLVIRTTWLGKIWKNLWNRGSRIDKAIEKTAEKTFFVLDHGPKDKISKNYTVMKKQEILEKIFKKNIVPIEEKPPPITSPIQANNRLKSCHVFLSSGPFEGEHTGDADYANKIVDILKNEKINAAYITGKTALYNPQEIKYEGYGNDKKIVDDDNRKNAVQNVLNHILSFDGPKIFNLQLRIPETGCMFLPEDLEKFKKQGIKVVVTCHEWTLNDFRPHYQKRALEYFKKADRVIFLNQQDAAGATELSGKFPTKLTVSAVPITVPVKIPTPESVVKRDKNILTFGIIRPNKGFEQAIRLGEEIKSAGRKDLKVLIAGKPVNFDYFISLAMPALFLNVKDIQRLKFAWDNDPKQFKEEIDKIQKQNRPDALPVEFHLDLNEQEMAALIARSKYAYKPDNKGFANNASAIINLVANGCITFAKWGIVTDKRFLKGGEHEKALILTKSQHKSLVDFSPDPKEVLKEILKREQDPKQKSNLETAAAALKATHDKERGVFSDNVVARDCIAAFEEAIGGKS